VAKVNAGEIMQKVLHSDIISGSNLQLDSKLNTAGNSIGAWQKSLNGKVSLNMENGAFNGINVMGNIIAKYEKYLKRDFPKQEIENRTLFQVVSAELSAKNGIVTSQKLLARSPELSADGNTTIDLPNAKMKLKMLIKGEKFPPFIAKSDAENLKTVKFPFTLEGPFDNLKPEFDYVSPLKGLLKQQAKKKIEQVKQKQKAKLQKKVEKVKQQQKEKIDEIKQQKKEELKNKLKDRLKGLF
jgi:AsmA protein